MSNTIDNSDKVATLNAISMGNAISTSTTCLPSAKEYSEAAEKIAFQFTAQWSEPKYQCPECSGGMCRNEMVVCTSYPPKYKYQCDKCGYVEYQHM